VDGKNGTSKGGHYRFTYRLSPQDEATVVDLTGEISQLSPIGEFFGRLFSGAYKSLIAKDLKAIKSHLESAPEPA
jgi:hypothetical protein